MFKSFRSTGRCFFCGRQVSRSAATRHLAACPKRKEAVATAEQRAGRVLTLYHLQVQDRASRLYWLHLEMRGDALLEDLDEYLRAIWLECCAHASMFTTGGWGGAEIDLSQRVDRVFASRLSLEHIYDFGTPSETVVRVVGERQGKPLSKHPIFLMARNDPPPIQCAQCAKPARWICPFCPEEPCPLCDEHSQQFHPDELLPVLNSPRTGMCAYVGPAEPPY